MTGLVLLYCRDPVPTDDRVSLWTKEPDEAVIRYVRELAKRLARHDHEAESCPSSQPEAKP
ncbi:hypothetical protein ABIE91_002567 [Bradyrhizobium elkanii]